MPIDVVLCGDRGVLFGFAVTVRSALEHAKRPLRVNLITAGLDAEEQERLRASWVHQNCADVRFAEIPLAALKEFRSTGYLKSKFAYARYFIDEAFPDIRRCIYLDADLLVLRDLSEAYDFDLGSNFAAAVRDVGVRRGSPPPDLSSRLGLREPNNYFNSGFLVIDLDAFRNHEIRNQLVTLSIAKFDDLHAQDQDALNVVLEDHVLLVDEGWNVSQYEKPFPLEGRIVHLIGTWKPWHSRYKKLFGERYYEEVIYAAFFSILDRTQFQNWRPTDFYGFGGLLEQARHAVPTADMVLGKVRRLLRGALPER